MSAVARPELAEHHLVTDGMRRAVGVWDDWSEWSAPIADSDIRRWAIAVYWPEPPPRRFWDETVADASSTRGFVAPEEFNPFAWPAPQPSRRTSAQPGADRRPDPAQVRGRVNGGCRAVYGVPMRVGDRIRRRVRLHGWTTRHSARGPLLLVDYEHEWRNQRDEHVRTSTYTLIHW